MTARGHRWKARFAAAVCVGAGLLFTACATTPQDTLSPAGPEARRIDRLFDPVFWIAVAVFVLVEGLLVYVLIRFRHRPGREDAPPQIHGNRRLEFGWTILPAVLLAGIAVPTIATIFGLSRAPSGDRVNITVTGHQWWWQVEYPDLDVVTANEIHIPTGKPVFVTLESNDVIHSFWIPRLAGKQDLVPGHISHVTLLADAPGEYRGQCAEYCGLSHANMRLLVFAQEQGDFDSWVSEQRQPSRPPAPGSAEARGLDVFVHGTSVGACISCHAIEGVPGAEAQVAPNLTHVASRTTFAGAIFPFDREHLRAWLADPPRAKPGAKMPDYHLSDAQIDDVIAFLESLR